MISGRVKCHVVTCRLRIVAEMLSKASNHDALSFHVWINIYMYIYVLSVTLTQKDPRFVYLYNTSWCVCRFRALSCAIVKQCEAKMCPWEWLQAPFDSWEPLQHNSHSKWWLQPTSPLAFTPSDTMVHNVKYKDTFVGARQRVGQRQRHFYYGSLR